MSVYVCRLYSVCSTQKSHTHTHAHTQGPQAPHGPPKSCVMSSLHSNYHSHHIGSPGIAPSIAAAFNNSVALQATQFCSDGAPTSDSSGPLRRPIARNKGRYDILRPVGMASGAVVGTVAVGARCAQSRLPGCSSPRFPKNSLLISTI